MLGPSPSDTDGALGEPFSAAANSWSLVCRPAMASDSSSASDRGKRFATCSSELWNYLPEAADLAALAMPAALTDPHGVAVHMVQFAIDAGGADNITVVLIPYPRPDAPDPEYTPTVSVKVFSAEA